MKRPLSRRAAAILLVLALSCAGGLSLAVVAFGQTESSPTSGYTSPTPSVQTQPVTPAPTATTPAPTATTPPEQTTTNGSKPTRAHGQTRTTAVPNGSGQLPSRATGTAPTKLAFTGGEPLAVGVFGLLLMMGGAALHLRRRRRRA